MASPFVISMKFTADGSGASAVTSDIRKEVTGLGQALDASSGKAIAFHSALAGQDTRARAADIEAYGRELDALRAQYNPLFAAEQRREAALAGIARAERLGAISAQESAAAIRAENAAYEQSIAAIGKNTDALERNQVVRAANDNHGSSFATANIAAQFQDVAVTSAMGMSPLQIALQQGTQISAAFGNMGAAGAVRALGGAFLSIISPVSLVTIALVAGTAAAIQYFSGLGSGAETADERLDHHLERIKALADGYEGATKAATDYVDQSRRAPEESVASNTKVELDEAVAQTLRDLDAIAQREQEIGHDLRNLRLDPETFGGIVEAAKGLDDLGLSANSTMKEINAVHSQLTNLANDPSAPQQARDYASDLLKLVENLKATRIEVGSLSESLNNMPSTIHTRIILQTEGFDKAFQDLSSIVPDSRPRTEIMREQNETTYQRAAIDAVTTSELNAATEKYQENLKGIAALEKEAADRDTAKLARSAAQISAYDREIESIQERTQAQTTETNVIGLGTYASEKARVTLELENAARKDAIGLSPQRVAQIEAEASAYAAAAAAQETMLQKQQAATEQYAFAKTTFRSFFADLTGGLREGQDGWEAFGNAGANALDRIADRALSMAADGIFDMIFGAITGALTGGGGGGSWNIPNTFQAGGFYPGFASGGWTGGSEGQARGLVHGEEFVVRAGPAAQHRALLETINSGGSPSMGGSGGVTLAPVYNFNGSGFTEAQARRMMQDNNRELMAMLPGALGDADRRAVRGTNG